MTHRPINIATAQSTVCADVRRNGETIRALMLRAHRAGVSLIHFPEGALSGYAKSEVDRWENFDFTGIGEELDSIARLAGRLGIWTVVGCAHRLTPPNRPHNSLYVISNEGQVHTRYDKRRCSNSEIADWYTPGFDPCVFDVNGIRFGCALYIEINFPEMFVEIERLGVHCVLISSYSRDDMFGIQAQAHAASFNSWISLSVPVNTSDALSSRFIGPDGRIVAKCRKSCSTFVVGTIDPGAPEWEIPLRRAKPWRRQARLGDIYEARRVSDRRSCDRSNF